MFIIGIVIAAGLIYCFCYALPLTIKEIYQMIKSGFIYNDDFEE
jgi:hypothetical protein